MSFGTNSGPPASARQVQYLLALLQKAGYTGFRDARRPLGLTQRQAGGRFTLAEASALIDRLTTDDADAGTARAGRDGEAARTSPDGPVEPAPLDPTRAELLRGVPADALASELERRGWTVVAPDPVAPSPAAGGRSRRPTG
jgi:hypothetical protein